MFAAGLAIRPWYLLVPTGACRHDCFIGTTTDNSRYNCSHSASHPELLQYIMYIHVECKFRTPWPSNTIWYIYEWSYDMAYFNVHFLCSEISEPELCYS